MRKIRKDVLWVDNNIHSTGKVEIGT